MAIARPGVRYRVRELSGPRRASRGYAALRLAGDRAILVDLQAADQASGDVFDLVDDVAEALRGPGARHSSSGPRARRRSPGGSKRKAARAVRFRLPLRGPPLEGTFDVDGASRAFDYRFLDHDVF